MQYQTKWIEKFKKSNFARLTKKYFQSRYNKVGHLDFLNVTYIDYEEPQNEWLLFFVEPHKIDTTNISIRIPHDKEKIAEYLPDGITFVTDTIIKKLLNKYYNGEAIILNYLETSIDFEDDIKYDCETDEESFPSGIPEKEMCDKLNKLFNDNELTFKKINYCINTSNNDKHYTKYFDECTYDDRRFIRYKTINDRTKEAEFYWLEIKSTKAKQISMK